jgi:hypothetical protein
MIATAGLQSSRFQPMKISTHGYFNPSRPFFVFRNRCCLPTDASKSSDAGSVASVFLAGMFLVVAAEDAAESAGDALPGGGKYRQTGRDSGNNTLKNNASGARIEISGGIRNARDGEIQQREGQQNIFQCSIHLGDY